MGYGEEPRDHATPAPRERGVLPVPLAAGECSLKRVIVTGDDFGVSVSVNEAIEEAHRNGILTAASLMVGAPAAADAVARARSLPNLAIGLHVVVARGRAMLAPEAIPLLADGDGELPRDLVSAGFRYYFRSTARRQLADEIEAQFVAFRASGLALDHVNAHNHMHLHPTVLDILFALGRPYGMRALRLPREPLPRGLTARARRLPVHTALWPWLGHVQRRIRAAGYACNDYFFGLHDSGHLTTDRVVEILGDLPPGTTELGFHPAKGRWAGADPEADGYDYGGELAALTSSVVARQLDHSHARRCAFRDIETS